MSPRRPDGNDPCHGREPVRSDARPAQPWTATDKPASLSAPAAAHRTPRSSMSDTGEVLGALQMVALEACAAGTFRALVPPGPSCARRFPALATERIELEREFPFAAAFLPDAEAFWQGPGGATLKSGCWTQADAAGLPCVLELTAVRMARPGRRVLVLEFLGQEYQELQSMLQAVRERTLAHEHLSRLHAALRDNAARLQRLAEERREAVALLRRSRDELEDQVAERTVALTEANRRLEDEAVRRQRAHQELLAHQAQLRSLTEQLAMAEERERRQVAQYIHDRIGQSLAAMKLQLGRLGARLGDPAATAQLAQLDGLVEEVIADTRGLTFDLGSPLLYEMGLEHALQDLVARFEQTHGITAHFQGDGSGAGLDEHGRLMLFQGVRELLHNVVKHADARAVLVRCRRVDDQVEVAVRDNGQGFAAGEHAFRMSAQGGFGLFHLRERLPQFGGGCSIQSRPGAGTEVTLRLPLAAAAHEE